MQNARAGMIRRAISDDAYGITSLLISYCFSNNIYSNSRINVSKFRNNFEVAVEDSDTIIIIHEDCSVIDGVIIGHVFDLSWSDTKISSQEMLFVQETERGKRIANELIQSYIKESKELGATVIEMGSIIKENIEGACNFFNKLGFDQVGTVHHMEINGKSKKEY